MGTTRMKLGRLMVLAFMTVVTMLASVSVTSGAEKVVPERLLFIANEAYGTPFQSPMGVFYDSKHDEILVADTGNHRIVILDGKDGYPKAAFTRRVKRNAKGVTGPGEPRSIAVNSLGEIFIVDNLCDYVEVCDFRGERLMEIRLEDHIQPAEAPAQFTRLDLKPVAVAIGPSDNLYIATPCWILVFDREFELQKQFGGRDQGTADFSAITDLWVDGDGRMFVTDLRGLGVTVLSPEGEVLLAFGGHDVGFSNFSMPTGIITDRRGYIWVADQLRHIVSIFDADGKFLDYIGAFGAGPGQFAFPSALAASNDGKIVVLERVTARFQCFQLPPPDEEAAAEL